MYTGNTGSGVRQAAESHAAQVQTPAPDLVQLARQRAASTVDVLLAELRAAHELLALALQHMQAHQQARFADAADQRGLAPDGATRRGQRSKAIARAEAWRATALQPLSAATLLATPAPVDEPAHPSRSAPLCSNCKHMVWDPEVRNAPRCQHPRAPVCLTWGGATLSPWYARSPEAAAATGFDCGPEGHYYTPRALPQVPAIDAGALA